MIITEETLRRLLEERAAPGAAGELAAALARQLLTSERPLSVDIAAQMGYEPLMLYVSRDSGLDPLRAARALEQDAYDLLFIRILELGRRRRWGDGELPYLAWLWAHGDERVGEGGSLADEREQMQRLSALTDAWPVFTDNDGDRPKDWEMEDLDRWRQTVAVFEERERILPAEERAAADLGSRWETYYDFRFA